MCPKCFNTGSYAEGGKGIYQVIPCLCRADYEHDKDPDWITFKERLRMAIERNNLRKNEQSKDGKLLSAI
jgi:hypothetical protein